jgi:hypothetical protein
VKHYQRIKHLQAVIDTGEADCKGRLNEPHSGGWFTRVADQPLAAWHRDWIC